VREGDYEVLRNTSGGPIVCARDQPQQVRNDVRSRVHCSKTCLQNNQCSSFNYKDTVSASGPGYKTYTCEHFNGYPSNFTVDPACRHYAVRAHTCLRNNLCIITTTQFAYGGSMKAKSHFKTSFLLWHRHNMIECLRRRTRNRWNAVSTPVTKLLCNVYW